MGKPSIGLSGLIVAVYGGVLLSGLCGLVITTGLGADSNSQMLYFLAAGVCTAILTYLIQAFALETAGSTIDQYVLECGPNGNCTVRGSRSGTSPVNDKVWQMPSATAQMLGMAAAYWTAEIVAANSDVSDVTNYIRVGILWAVVAAVVAYALKHGFVNSGHAMIGLGLGTAVGLGFSKLQSLA